MAEATKSMIDNAMQRVEILENSINAKDENHAMLVVSNFFAFLGIFVMGIFSLN